MPEIEQADLLVRIYNMKEYCVGKGHQIVRDFPTPKLFRPDAANEVSLYAMSVWTEHQIREHVGNSSRRTRQGQVKRKDPDEFGLCGLSEEEVTNDKEYAVKRNHDPGTELVPPNDAHCAIIPASGQDKDTVEWELYNLAVGLSPPPRLRDVQGLQRCAKWQLILAAGN